MERLRFWISYGLFWLCEAIEPPGFRNVLSSGELRKAAKHIYDQTKKGARSGEVTMKWEYSPNSPKE